MTGSPEQIAERAVLGAVLTDPKRAAAVVLTLKPEDFGSVRHRLIFGAMQDELRAGREIDVVAIHHALGRSGKDEPAGGAAYLGGLIDGACVASHAEHYAALVRESATLRFTALAAKTLAQKAENGGTAATTLLREAESSLLALAQRDGRSSLVPVGTAMPGTLDALERRYEDRNATHGVPTGYPTLDRVLGGLRPGQLVILAARPSVGKSALAGNITLAAARAGHPVALFALEMTQHEMHERWLSDLSQVDHQAIRTGRLSADAWTKLTDAVPTLCALPIAVDDSACLSPVELGAKCRRAKAERQLALVIVDHLQLMAPDRPSENRTRELTATTGALKALAKDLGAPVIALSQLNRDVEKRPDRRPQLSDLRESGSIEQDADIVIFLHRPEVGLDPRSDRAIACAGMAEVIIAKHRGGPTGVVPLVFRAAHCRFDEAVR